MIVDNARLAYETYAEAIHWTQYVTDPRDPSRVIIVALGPWEEVPTDRQAAWQRVVDAVRNVFPGIAPSR